MTDLQQINLNNINKRYDNLPPKFTQECTKNNIYKYPTKKDSTSFQCLALLLYHPNCFVTREILNEFFIKIGIKTSDSIQAINKTEQWGFSVDKTGNGKNRKYYITEPYKFNLIKVKARKCNKLKEDGRDFIIDNVKKQLKTEILDVENDKWQQGHCNPDLPDKIIWQPPIQARYRDDYIFYEQQNPLNRFPLPNKLCKMLKNKDISLTDKQVDDYISTLTNYKNKKL